MVHTYPLYEVIRIIYKRRRQKGVYLLISAGITVMAAGQYKNNADQATVSTAGLMLFLGIWVLYESRGMYVRLGLRKRLKAFFNKTGISQVNAKDLKAKLNNEGWSWSNGEVYIVNDFAIGTNGIAYLPLVKEIVVGDDHLSVPKGRYRQVTFVHAADKDLCDSTIEVVVKSSSISTDWNKFVEVIKSINPSIEWQ